MALRQACFWDLCEMYNLWGQWKLALLCFLALYGLF